MKFGWLRGYTLLYMIFLYAPIIVLPVFAFNSATIIALPLKGFSTEWFVEMAANRSLRQALGNSLLIAGSSAVFATCLGLFAARASTRFHFPGRGAMVGLIMLPLVMPEIIVAMSLLVVLASLGLPQGIPGIMLGHTLLCMPYAAVILRTAFASLDRSLEEAAYDLGETKWSAFRLVIVPLIMPGIISSLLLCFMISLDEFVVAFFLGGKSFTLPSYLFSLLRFPKQVPVVLAVGTVLVMLSILLLILAEYFRRVGLKRTGANTGGLL